VWIATGRAFPDALAAGPAVARLGHSLLLVDGADLDGSPATRDVLAGAPVQRVRLLGGSAAISPRVERQVRDLLP
jgi:hypothetical protein